ncbi:MAG: GNAT family N-acetyltransferase [Gemmatimonadetes bacterium]|nr:GNAT family N-acetyltransferase [Gemmatimonadota bacterium]
MIRGEHIVLRTVRESDLDALFDLLSDQSTRGEHFPLRLPSDAAFRKEYRETGFWGDSFGRLLVCDPEGRILGSIWYFQTAPYLDGLEIGYHLFDVASRGKGHMSEALKLLAGFLFATRKINRLQLGIMPENEASRRVAQNCGFRSEGIARGAIFLRGGNHDLEMFSLLRADAGRAKS